MNHAYLEHVKSLASVRYVGRVCTIAGAHIECEGPLAKPGDICEIAASDAGAPVLAEVAAVRDTRVLLTLLTHNGAIRPDARVVLKPSKARASVGNGFGGRLVDAMGAPLDAGPAIIADTFAALDGAVLAPLARCDHSEVLVTGVRAIDALTPIARGQRIGVFSASGVGKTTLMRQLLVNVACDRRVLCLVGERGREVEHAWSVLDSRPDRDAFTLVSATSDVSPALRARAVQQALSLAEYWRDRGEHVLLVIDSITRYAMALREIGLAADLAPTARGYTANVFAALPRVVERGGASRAGGAITTVATVLSEGDDVDDPIVETMKSLLDGHIVLSRRIAEQGRYPAIDPLRSISRLASQIMSREHARAARRIVALTSAYEEARILIESGLYKQGADKELDAAVAARPAIESLLAQPEDANYALAHTLSQMHRIEAAHARP
ncbi:MAG: FliI/YscN family ATPase [Terricaulis sp.]